MSDLITVGIIDDNKELRDLLKDLLASMPGVKCIGEAHNLGTARGLLVTQKPDVAILDISIDNPEGGFDLLKERDYLSPQTKIIILSSYDESTHAALSFRAGAKGYVCKDKAVDCLMDAIFVVHAGHEFISQRA